MKRGEMELGGEGLSVMPSLVGWGTGAKSLPIYFVYKALELDHNKGWHFLSRCCFSFPHNPQDRNKDAHFMDEETEARGS